MTHLARGQTRRVVAGLLGQDGAHVDHHRAGFQGLAGRVVVLEEHLGHGATMFEHGEHHIGLGHGFGRAGGHPGTVGGQGFGLGGRAVPDGQRQACGQQATGHGRAHQATPQ